MKATKYVLTTHVAPPNDTTTATAPRWRGVDSDPVGAQGATIVFLSNPPFPQLTHHLIRFERREEETLSWNGIVSQDEEGGMTYSCDKTRYDERYNGPGR
jgi:hypothetical protein